VNQTWNDRVARAAITFIEQGRVHMYATKDEYQEKESIFQELKRLKRRTSGGVTPKIKLEAPAIAGLHDDKYSALSRGIYLVKEHFEENRVTTTSAKDLQQRKQAQKTLKARVETIRRQKTGSRQGMSPGIRSKLGKR
jgi:hypothetical protein